MTRYRGISDSQANAEALARRSSPYTAASEQSIRLQWSARTYDHLDLRGLVNEAVHDWAQEVPEKLHEHALADDGTPRMTSRAVGYIFGHDEATDASDDEFVAYYNKPFRAVLSHMSRRGEPERKRAAIVGHIVMGSQRPAAAAMAEGVPGWCAKLVAEDALRSVLRAKSDLKPRPPRSQRADDAVA